MKSLKYIPSHICIIRHLNVNYKKVDTTIRKSFMQNLHSIIEENIGDEKFGILELCKTIGISRSQLHNKIKAATDLSTSIYIRNIRLSKAKSILQNSDLNVSEVAYEVGFKDASYFSRLFSEQYGTPPSRARKVLEVNHFEKEKNNIS